MIRNLGTLLSLTEGATTSSSAAPHRRTANVVADTGPPGSDAAREAYVEHSSKVLQMEIDRADRVEARAGSIVRTNISLIAAGLAVAAFMLGNDKSLHTPTICAFAAGVLLLIASTGLALHLHGKAGTRTVTSLDTLDEMQTTWWRERSHTLALHDVMKRNVSAIKKLRPQTNDRARWCNAAYYVQQGAATVLIVAAAIEILIRTNT